MKNLQEALKQRMEGMTNKRQTLVRHWAPYIDSVEQYMKENQDHIMTQWDKENIAVCLENAAADAYFRGKGNLFEATQEADISFLGICKCAA